MNLANSEFFFVGTHTLRRPVKDIANKDPGITITKLAWSRCQDGIDPCAGLGGVNASDGPLINTIQVHQHYLEGARVAIAVHVALIGGRTKHSPIDV